MWTIYEFEDRLEFEDDWLSDELEDEIDEFLADIEGIDEFLTAREMSRAVQRNQYWATQLGWQNHIDAVVRLLGLDITPTPASPELAQAVADWQLDNDLNDDGILGPDTWYQMRTVLGISDTSSSRRSRHQALCPPPANLSQAERTALEITTRFETGTPFSCSVSDTDGISMGMIQWNLLAGTLQDMLARFERETGRLRDFFDAETPRLLRLIALRGNKDLQRQAVQEAKQEGLAARWQDRLLRLCSDPQYCRLQTNSIVNQYMRPAQNAARQLGLTTVRGLSMMFDINVGDGFGLRNKELRQTYGNKLNLFNRRIQDIERQRGRPLTEQEKLIQIADIAAELVRSDLRDRRRTRRRLIAQGRGSFRGRNWDLDRDYPNLNNRWQVSP